MIKMIHTKSGYDWSYRFQKEVKTVNSWTSNNDERMSKGICQLNESNKKKFKKSLNTKVFFFKEYTVFDDKLSLSLFF